MFISAREKLTFSDVFLEAANSTHRQYEALRAYFVEGLPSAEVAVRFGYSQRPSSGRSVGNSDSASVQAVIENRSEVQISG